MSKIEVVVKVVNELGPDLDRYIQFAQIVNRRHLSVLWTCPGEDHLSNRQPGEIEQCVWLSGYIDRQLFVVENVLQYVVGVTERQVALSAHGLVGGYESVRLRHRRVDEQQGHYLRMNCTSKIFVIVLDALRDVKLEELIQVDSVQRRRYRQLRDELQKVLSRIDALGSAHVAEMLRQRVVAGEHLDDGRVA